MAKRTKVNPVRVTLESGTLRTQIEWQQDLTMTAQRRGEIRAMIDAWLDRVGLQIEGGRS